MAGKVLAEVMRTSLGPKGMDKMLVDQFGDITISNDGATILDEIDIVHPGAKFIAKLAKSQDIEVGDGTTTTVVLAGELLSKAEELLKEEIHPTMIIDGYQKALKKALEILEEIGISIDTKNKEMVKEIVKTSVASKILAGASDFFAEIAIKAVESVMTVKDGKIKIPLGDIKIEKREGGSLEDSELIDGIVLDKEVVHHRMPRRVEDAKIALISYALELEKPEIADVNVMMDTDAIENLLKWEKEKLREMADRIIQSGANVVFCQKGIDDIVQHYLAKNGIMAIRRVKKSDMEKLAKATGAKIIMNEDFLEPNVLGYAKIVEERKIGDENMIFVRGCKNPKAVSILIRGGTKLIVEEAERSLNDMLNTVRNIYLEPKVVPAGGAPELEIAIRLEKYAEEVGGKESLAIKAFAEAIQSIPATLIETAGLDVIETLEELRTYHAQGNIHYGIDVVEGKIKDMAEAKLFDPIRVKKNAIKSATEAALMILRIDDIIAAKEAFEARKEEGKGPGEEESE